MAVQSYLTEWDQCCHSDNFKHVTLDRFLAIPHRELMDDYGASFATQHRNLCKTLRKVLTKKLLVDRRQCTPSTPRKRRPLEIDNLSCKIKSLSIRDRVGVKNKSFNGSPRSTALSVSNCKTRVSVKDRLGAPVRARKGRPEGRFWLRTVHRMRNGNSESPDTNRSTPRNRSYRAKGYREDLSRIDYPGSGATSFKNTYKCRRTLVYV